MNAMPRFLYQYIELFGYMGAGTPDDPGSDFGMCVWIDAPTEDEARGWGKRVLEDYVRARYAQSDPDLDPTRFEGDIVHDRCQLEQAEAEGYPQCEVGQTPEWSEPW